MAFEARPIVSVAVTSFNSERWIAKAIDSVLVQRTEFPVEIVIADDCSQDQTVRVARSYQERYPNIRVLARPKNIGIQRNYYDTWENCNGKYIAWLDADDYWTDPSKLSTQVKVMEDDSTISVCCHCVRRVSPEGRLIRERFPSIPAGRYGLDELLRRDFVPSVSALFRNGLQRGLPAWYFDVAPITDYPLWVISALSGDIMLLESTMADYVHSPGSAFSKDDLTYLRQQTRVLECARPLLPVKWQRKLGIENGNRYQAMAYLLRKKGDFVASRKTAFKAFTSPHLQDSVASKTRVLLAAIVREAQWRMKVSRPHAK